jgi:hypothetical protein
MPSNAIAAGLHPFVSKGQNAKGILRLSTPRVIS